MNGTIIDYVNNNCNHTFMEKPLNDVDMLVLSQFVYLKFDGLVPSAEDNLPSTTMDELFRHPDYEKLYGDIRYEKDNRALFEGMLASKRFCKLKMNCYINIVEKEWETQFSAITFILENGIPVIVFRGTDESIVGWKEDFNMAFLSPVPGQAYSAKYLNIVSGKFKDNFYVGGHSKGGNLALYSSMSCMQDVKERIIKVYSFDGPGFRPEILEKWHYDEIKDRVVKFIPHSSLFGMLFSWDNDYTVVDSKSFGVYQHIPYNWMVEDDHFEVVSELDKFAVRRDNTINEWLLSLDEDELRTFGDTCFQVINAAEVDDTIHLTADLKKSRSKMLKAMEDLDPETTAVLKKIIKNLFEITKVRFKHYVDRGIIQAEDSVRDASKKLLAASNKILH